MQKIISKSKGRFRKRQKPKGWFAACMQRVFFFLYKDEIGKKKTGKKKAKNKRNRRKKQGKAFAVWSNE